MFLYFKGQVPSPFEDYLFQIETRLFADCGERTGRERTAEVINVSIKSKLPKLPSFTKLRDRLPELQGYRYTEKSDDMLEAKFFSFRIGSNERKASINIFFTGKVTAILKNLYTLELLESTLLFIENNCLQNNNKQ